MTAARRRPVGTRVVLADDHAMVRDGVREALEAQPDLEVVAEASDGPSAVHAAVEHRPDVVLIDVSMPGLNGIEATRRILGRVDTVRVLCVSMHSDPMLVNAALEAGASGYILKESPLGELVDAIRTVMRGRTYVDPGVARRMLDDEPAKTTDGRASIGPSMLTSREREVLQLVAEGHSNRTISERLLVSAKTVSTHRQRLMDKLGIHNVAGLTRFAIRHGLIQLDAPARPAEP